MHTYIHTHIHIHGNQTAEHMLLECGILREERERLTAAVAKTDNWPIKKGMLITKTPQSIRRIHENVGQNKRTQHTVKKEQSMKVPTYIHNCYLLTYSMVQSPS